MNKVMKACVWMMLPGTTAAQAMPAGEGENMSLLGYLFLGFFALVIVSQLVPAAILFFGMVKSVFFAREDKKVVE